MHANLIVCKKIKQLKMQSEKNEVSFINQRFTQYNKTFIVSFFKTKATSNFGSLH
jgi:hypothetical protein